MTLKQKLIERARQLGLDVPDDADFRRLRPGSWQRAAGAWSWCAYDQKGRELMGSCFSITALVKADEIEILEDGLGAPELCPVLHELDVVRTD